MRTAHLVSLPLLAAALSFAAEPAGQPGKRPQPLKSPEPPNVEVIHDVEIGAGGGRLLHAEIARPKNPPPTPMPAVLAIHGGGWSKGTHKFNQAVWLATKGYFTASIEYRLSGEAKWPAQIEDCKLGVRWLRANAAKYNVNPDCIGCWGSSAGGHLVACLGTMDEPQFEGTGGYAGVSSRVQAVVDYCGPADFTEGSAGIQGAVGDRDALALLGLFGAPFKKNPDLWKQGSPVLHVKAGTPPFLIVHGDKDTLVPLAQSEHLVAALQKAGVPVEFITVKGGGHGMSTTPGEPPPEPDSNALHAAVLAFFDKHLRK
jgi:acetyl esterase/lipase